MSFAISTTSMGGPLIDRLRAAARAGFLGIEFFWQDCIDSGLEFLTIGAISRDLGLTPVSLQPLRGSETRGGPGPAALVEAERFLDSAAELGVNMIGLCASENELACGPEEAAVTLRVISAMAGTRGLKVGFEALSWSTVIRDAPVAWEAVKQADAPNLGVIIDSFHIYARSQDLKPIAEIPSDRIFLIQLASAIFPDGASLTAVSRHHRLFPDEGAFNPRDLVSLLLANGYDGVVSLELFNDELRRRDPYTVAMRGWDSLARLTQPL